MHNIVQEYYGQTLQHSGDLKTSACCDISQVPEWLKPLLARIHPEVLSRYYGCGLVCPPLLEGCRVLDLGCGSGRDAYALAQLGSLLQHIGPEHIMASGALPPGFPPVPVEGELYWDGGIVSNTPLEVVLDDVPRVNTLCFMVDLFNPIGPEPTSLPEVYARHKDIAYANRSERGIRDYQEKHNLRRAVHALYKALPESKRNDPELKELAELGCRTTMEVVHLSYRGKPWETATRDADFSAAAISERWDQGYQDASDALSSKRHG